MAGVNIVFTFFRQVAAMTARTPAKAMAYRPTFSAEMPVDLRRDASVEAAMRACIDLPVLVRTHGGRMVVAAGALAFATTKSAADAARAAWKHSLAGYEMAAGCIALGRDHPDLQPATAALLGDLAQSHRDAVNMILEYPERAGRLLTAVEAGEVGTTYDALMTFMYEDYVPCLTALETAIKRAVQERRSEGERAADAARKRAQDARGQIGSIARTVRLISLNARVEAARAGEAGHAFAVIASEIRALSERTETASTELEASIDAILDHVQRH